MDRIFDLAIIGGGINGCGIARDAAGRGNTVFLCEMNDLASGTSSWSTKLVHGGLRYLEYYEFRLVREALIEREILWQIAPHIIRPLRFVLPHHAGLRPAWMLRLGLFLCGDLGPAPGRGAEALTLWAARAAVDRREGRTYPSLLETRREERQRQARQALGPGRAREAEERGAAMSLATAAEYALMLTEPGPPQPAVLGPGELSARERELVRLVAQGRTNAQIAAELYISVRTVGSHLDRIRDKTGCRRRADLTRLALTMGLV